MLVILLLIIFSFGDIFADRQDYGNRSSHTFGTVDKDQSVMLLYYFVGHGQAYTRAAYLFICFIEFFFNSVEILLGNSDARIAYGYLNTAVLDVLLNEYLTARLIILKGVVDSVYKYLLNAVGVAVTLYRIYRGDVDQLDLLLFSKLFIHIGRFGEDNG